MVILAFYSVVFAQQSHSLNEITTIDTDLDMNEYDLNGVGNLVLSPGLDRYIHFPRSPAGDGFSFVLDGSNNIAGNMWG